MKPEYIIIHHSAITDGRCVDWQAIRRYHTSYRIDGEIVTKEDFVERKEYQRGTRFETPWSDIGYHFGIELVNGRYEILIGRSLLTHGAHCPGYNDKSIGVCFVGNYDKIAPRQKVIHMAAKRLLAPLCVLYNLQDVDKIIRPHSYFAKKTCPGKLFSMTMLRELTKEFMK